MNRERWKRFEQTFSVLRAIAAGIIVVSSLAAPNLLQVLPVLFPEEFSRKKRPTPADVSKMLLRLKRRGLISLKKTGNGFALRLTPTGQELHDRLFLKSYKIPRPRRWDGKWRVVIFDIHEERRTVRDLIRQRLGHLGFIRLQDSVWIHPYECEEAIEILKTANRVRHDVHFLLVSRLAQDSWLRRHFGLPYE